MLRLLRKTHLYLGLFIAPALLFFAFTGAVQTLSLHEAAGTDYKPPALLASLGQLHKKQTTVLPVRRPPAVVVPDAARVQGSPSSDHPEHPEHPERPDHAHHAGTDAAPGAQPVSAQQVPAPPPVTLAAKQKHHLPLKIFFVLVSLGLFTSTLTGVYMAYKYERGKVLVTGLLILGLVIPILLIRL